jgi:uncharacterized iron-regulated protein
MKLIVAWYKFGLFGTWLILLGGCTSHGDLKPPALILSQHTLVDKIWDVQAGRFIDETQLIRRMLASDYVLLGEIHDNSRHHQLQARVIDWLRKQQQLTSVSFEMISYQQGKVLKQHSYASSSELIELLNQTKSAWPYKRDYQIVFDSVIAAGFDILPANLDQNELTQVMNRGEVELSEDIRQMLKQTPFTDKQTADLQNEIVRAHCNMMPPDATQPMVLVQRARDAVMSLSLLNSPADIKVLIAGAGHTRVDRGVPLYLRKRDKTARMFSLAFQEVNEGATSIDAYSERWGGQGLPFDYVWFTPAVHRPDPCEQLKRQLKKTNTKGVQS